MVRIPASSRQAVARRVAATWSRLSLTAQFILVAMSVMICSMTIYALWLDERIKAGVVQSAASGAALYINSAVEPHLQALATTRTLAPEKHRTLDALFMDTPLGNKVVVVKVWRRDGTVLYSNRKEIVGKSYPLTKRLAEAWAGAVGAQIEDVDSADSVPLRQLPMPLLKIHAPVREAGSDRIIAVVEFYQVADQVQVALRSARTESSVVVALVTLALLSALFLIVRKGSRTIESQQKALHDRISELSGLLAQNENLRRRIDELYVRSAESHEAFLRRIGLELHDGPAQLIAFALLRIDSLRPRPGKGAGDAELDDYERISTALVDALADIRNISAGLILPELEAASPAEVLRLAARNHERRTGTRVRCEVDSMPLKLSPLLKSCLYRFTQAALNNAYQHAGGKGQAVQGTHRDGVVEIAVSDAGPGFLPAQKDGKGMRLGLIGMRDRVASLGGTFDLSSRPGSGTRLTARFEVTDDASRGAA
jgi:signal transduction histidine kinase